MNGPMGVRRPSLAVSYGDVFVMAVVLDLSVSAHENELSLVELANKLLRVVLNTQANKTKMMMTVKAPISEPSRVCLSSSELTLTSDLESVIDDDVVSGLELVFSCTSWFKRRLRLFK